MVWKSSSSLKWPLEKNATVPCLTNPQSSNPLWNCSLIYNCFSLFQASSSSLIYLPPNSFLKRPRQFCCQLCAQYVSFWLTPADQQEGRAICQALLSCFHLWVSTPAVWLKHQELDMRQKLTSEVELPKSASLEVLIIPKMDWKVIFETNQEEKNMCLKFFTSAVVELIQFP